MYNAMTDSDGEANKQNKQYSQRKSKRAKIENVKLKDYVLATSSQSMNEDKIKSPQSIGSTELSQSRPTLSCNGNFTPIVESIQEGSDASKSYLHDETEVDTSNNSGPLNSSAPQYLSNSSVSDEDVSEEFMAKKKRGVGKDWIVVENFADPKMAEEKMASLTDFAHDYKHITSAGRSSYFYCKQKPCPAKYQLFYNSSTTVMLKSSDHHHVEKALTNENPGPLTRIPAATKAKLIAATLRNQYPELPLPTVKQLYSLNSRESKGQTKISLGELEQFLTDKSPIPHDEHTAFVVNFEINYETPCFRFFFSTKNLLRQTSLSKIVHADTTYKLNYEGFPVLVVGVTDLDRHLHTSGVAVCTEEKTADFSFLFQSIATGMYKILGICYAPTTLVSDAAEAIANGFKAVFGEGVLIIMCWAHVKRAILKRYKNNPNINDILKDLDLLQLSPSTEYFQIGLKIFLEKWKGEEEFIAYFKEEWVDHNCNWFEGAQKLTPKTDNALEGKNRWIKDSHTLRDRVPLKQFLNDMLKMVNDWSCEYIQDKVFMAEQTVDLPVWTKTYQWVKSAKRVLTIRNDNLYVFKVPATGFDSVVEFDLGQCTSLDDFKKLAFAYYTVEMPGNNWKKGTCTCPAFCKKFICKHLVGMAVRYKLVEVPLSAKSVPIGQKRKRGRPRKAKHALLVD
ncbi:hypothetical protein HA402_004954 [Bradysia odoriphaga]|nr:hypothetical protein HA402_004954 [Bradysia odoriphaga]